jgi:hypothetical protein
VENSTHYVATVQVHRVDIQTTEPHGTQPVTRVTKLDTPVRHVTKVAGFEVKSTDLEHLLARTEQHLRLVEDLEVIDPVADTGAKKPSYRVTDRP